MQPFVPFVVCQLLKIFGKGRMPKSWKHISNTNGIFQKTTHCKCMRTINTVNQKKKVLLLQKVEGLVVQ